jgi:AraC-like DNA-binding protein
MAHRRNQQQVASDREAYFLLSMPLDTSVHFRQGSTDLSISGNQFIIELSHQPYEYTQENDGEVWTVKIPLKIMADFITSPEHYSSYAFDTQRGVGRIFADFVRAVPGRLCELGPSAQEDLSRIMLELLGLTLENEQAVLGANSKPVRYAMLVRVEKYIRNNLADPHLDPDKIARATGMSTRYLHKLFEEAGMSVMKWIQDQRLGACDADLRHCAPNETVAEVGYRWGFTNAAHFSRLYKSKFGFPPKDRRKASMLTFHGR